jgi:hypothetical protein
MAVFSRLIISDFKKLNLMLLLKIPSNWFITRSPLSKNLSYSRMTNIYLFYQIILLNSLIYYTIAIRNIYNFTLCSLLSFSINR